jgi:GT2 family glycosyltransferase
MRADLITVFHNATNYEQHCQLQDAIAAHEPTGGYRFIAVDNRTTNRGFAKACNLGALHAGGDAPIIGFLNPDVIIEGPFLDAVERTLDDRTVITGARFGKPQRELDIWGVRDWVCGAALFVQRRWFQSVGGFDEQFVWSFEETDLIRRAETDGWQVRSILLPIRHESPAENSPEDAQYKQLHFSRGQQRYYRKWGTT